MSSQNGSQHFDFDLLHRLEYVEANGLGGYASGTFSGAHSRKYHGLLVAALKPPVQRAVVVSKIEETITSSEGVAELSCNQFPGVLHPFGVRYLVSFERSVFPQWTYHVHGISIRKTIAAIHGEHTTVVTYEVIEAPERFTLHLRPFYASRDIHHLSHNNAYIGQHYIFDNGVFQTMNYQRCPEFFISVPRSTFEENRVWYENFEYQQEYLRGMDFREDLFTHGSFAVTLRKGSKLGVIVSLKDPKGRDAFRLLKAEQKRRADLIKPFSFHPLLERLVLAADQFVVKRDDLNTIIAGYPWFTDWGRDTMIALPGICLVTGKYKEARRILQKFSEHVSDGMLPNRFPDSGEKPEYNTIDATLWYFVAVYKYFRYSGDKTFVQALMPLLRDIVQWHYRGTRYNIKVDHNDGLLAGGADGVQLTWMDAKIGDWVVTPRRGKPVEINALWYNVLRIMEFFCHEFGELDEAAHFLTKAIAVQESFNKTFWNEDTGSLYDFVHGDYKNGDIRPNQVYALSLPFPVLRPERAKSVLGVVETHLLTPFGLRSLSPAHSAYAGRYEGDPSQRDSIYHQGPAWSHLLGAYVDALFATFGEAARRQATEVLEAAFASLETGAIGSIAEIFDGDPPYESRGCVAQAWSVGELLRVCVEYKIWHPRLTQTTKVPVKSV